MWEAEKDENLGGPAKVHGKVTPGQGGARERGGARKVGKLKGGPGRGAPKNGGQGRVVQGRGPEVSFSVVPDKM